MTIEPVTLAGDWRGYRLWRCSNKSTTFGYIRAASEQHVRKILSAEVERYMAGQQDPRPEVLQ